MSKETHVQRKKGDPTNGKTDYERLQNITEEEIDANARSDSDAPLLSEDDLKKFNRTKS